MTANPLDPITGPDRSWWSTSRRRIFYDAHTPDWTDEHQRGAVPVAYPVLSETDPDRDLELIARSGADSVVLFAKCQYGNAYYPTRIGRQHGALAGRDLFGAQLRAAHRHGLRVIAYYSNMWDVTAAGEHPEWNLRPLPARGATGRWPALCLRSGYRRHALDQVREIARGYPVDGLWSDILTAGPCVCPRCEAAFRSAYGRDMPMDRADEGWLDLVRFSQDTLRTYLAEQREVLRAERPDAALVPNFYATTFVDAVIGLTADHLALADIGSSEGYTDWHGLGFPSFAARYVRAAVADRPAEVLVSRFVHTWDFTLRSVAQLRFEAFTVAAHGLTVTVDDQPAPSGAPQAEVYQRLAPVFARIAERTPWLHDTTPYPYAALWTGQAARELDSLLGTTESPSVGEQSAQFPPGDRRPGPSDLAAAVAGTYRALVESHLPVAFLDERPERLAGLGAYRVLVLADVLSLGAAEVAAIDGFVRAGGGLVVTGPVGVRDGHGRERATSALAGLLGVDFGRPGDMSYPYLRLADPELGDQPLVPHYGPIAELTGLRAGARVLAWRTDPVLETDKTTFWHNNLPGPGAHTDLPVIIERQVGAGRVVVSAARLGNNHARLGHWTYRRMLDVLVRRVGGEPPVTVDGGHRATELVLARRGRELIVHLVTGAPVTRLDLPGAQQPAAIEDVASVAALDLRLPPDTVSAVRVVGGRTVPLPVRAGGTVRLRDLDDWETVVVRRGPAS
ncbi:alpha-amylase family protein [Micromonospora cathayae]|uniref:Beta-galactosidase trimerisation domain-containing protein n=1 Tax=Micromonospora cathayae TaxID=3028804 RepID=A0ABY7ZLL1_9ACTN|nr:alpha-amylase family protein [Micromonospora sp. HUAS 3]WDZ83777.1 hypothetical protein PVK37_25440 [Micromonospora sp. HUAS 3]